jgi:homoserine kinase
MEAGALGCSISGAGPTLFAWALARDAHRVLEAMRREFTSAAIRIDEWLVDFETDGAHVIESGS